MNTSLLVVITGFMLLVMPQTAWLGIAIAAIGGVLYVSEQKASKAEVSPEELQMMQAMAMQRMSSKQRGKAGFNWNLIEPGTRTKTSPYVDKGLVNIPLPVDEELANFMEMKYSKPTRARGTKVDLTSGENWLPKF